MTRCLFLSAIRKHWWSHQDMTDLIDNVVELTPTVAVEKDLRREHPEELDDDIVEVNERISFTSAVGC